MKKKLTLQPLHTRILVKPLEANKNVNGIIIPDTMDEKQQHGVVLGTGEGKQLANGKIRKLTVVKGDRIVYGKYTGVPVTLEGDDLILIREEEVYAKFKDNDGK